MIKYSTCRYLFSNINQYSWSRENCWSYSWFKEDFLHTRLHSPRFSINVNQSHPSICMFQVTIVPMQLFVANILVYWCFSLSLSLSAAALYVLYTSNCCCCCSHRSRTLTRLHTLIAYVNEWLTGLAFAYLPTWPLPLVSYKMASRCIHNFQSLSSFDRGW